MGQTSLKGLALMHVHYGVPVDHEEVIKRFVRKHLRRIVLPDFGITSSEDSAEES